MHVETIPTYLVVTGRVVGEFVAGGLMGATRGPQLLDANLFRELRHLLDLHVDMRINHLLDGSLMATGARALHRGHGGGKVLDEDELGTPGDGVAAIIHPNHLEGTPDNLVRRQLLKELRHTARTLALELKLTKHNNKS
jgi:hypothetical protein